MSIEQKLDEIISRIEKIEKKIQVNYVEVVADEHEQPVARKKSSVAIWIWSIVGLIVSYNVILFIVETQNPYANENYNRTISFIGSVLLVLIVLFVISQKREEKSEGTSI